MSTPIPEGGSVELAALALVVEFVEKVQSGQADDDDWAVRLDHPLVVAIEAVLESLTKGVLGAPIIGANPGSLKDIEKALRDIKKTRRSYRRGGGGRVARRPPDHLVAAFDNFLVTSAEIIENVSESQYDERDHDLDARFYSNLVPDWLDSLREWSEEGHFASLSNSVGHASRSYSAIGDSISERFGRDAQLHHD